MRKTTEFESQNISPSTFSTPKLMEYTGLGRASAVKLGEQAHAKLRVGRRVLWSVSKIQAYIDSIAE